MQFGNSVIITFVGIVAAYFAAVFGDAAAQWAVSANGWPVPVGIVTTIAAIVCVFCFFNGYHEVLDGDEDAPALAATTFVTAAWVFGFIATPITTFGIYPWTWYTGWAFLPIVASLYTLIVVKDIIVVAAAVIIEVVLVFVEWLRRPRPKDNVVSFKQRNEKDK